MKKFELPSIGCGTWTYDDASAEKNVGMALDAGYRLIDTASYYGNEKGVGAAVRNSGIDRSEITVSTKLWKADLGYEKVRPAFLKALDRLGLEYIDLYMIHWPAAEHIYPDWKELNCGTWAAMEELKEEGLVRHIGVSNFTPLYLEVLKEKAKLMPSVNQIEFHPGFTPMDTLNYCKENDIVCEAWSPFGRGEVFSHPVMQGLSEKYGKSVALICLSWLNAHGLIPIVKSEHRERLLENLTFKDICISEEDMATIDSIPFFGKLGYDPDTMSFNGI